MDKAFIFLGATVADAAARPLHWVYDPKKLKSYIKNKKEITFLKQNKSPFYSIKTGNVSGYNDVGQVMFKTLATTKQKSEILNLDFVPHDIYPGKFLVEILSVRNLINYASRVLLKILLLFYFMLRGSNRKKFFFLFIIW